MIAQQSRVLVGRPILADPRHAPAARVVTTADEVQMVRMSQRRIIIWTPLDPAEDKCSKGLVDLWGYLVTEAEVRCWLT